MVLLELTTNRRPRMATIGRALSKVKGQLSKHITDEQVEDLCRQNNHKFRKRKLGGPAGVVHLMLLQLLAAVSLSGLRHVAGISVTRQSINDAYKALPLVVWRALVRRVCPQGPALSVWHGLKVMLVDAMGIVVEDTRALSNKYGKASNGKVSTRHARPTPKLLALLDLAGGFIHQVIPLPWSRQERVCLTRLFKACGQAALILADRGLVGFCQIVMAQAADVHCLMRLPRWLVVSGRGKGNRRRLKKLGKQDMLVSWRRVRRPTWLSLRQWKALPEQTVLRQISFRITRKGFRTHWAWVITTLTDPVLYPAQEIVALYEKRWQVEVYFRDLKRTLKLKQTRSKSVEGVQKEILAFVVLYNLVRQVMLQAAQRQGVDADRISFADAARWLLWSEPGAELIDLVVNPKRKRDTQPRMLKHGRRKYSRLNKPRALLTKPACEAKL
jgi:hypothetical protein